MASHPNRGQFRVPLLQGLKNGHVFARERIHVSAESRLNKAAYDADTVTDGIQGLTQ